MTIDNDKELLIRLEEKVDTILERIQEIPKLENRLRDVEKCAGSIPEMKEDIKNLENKSNTWSVLNSLGVGIAAILGLWGK